MLYWSQVGKYQDLYEVFWHRYIPSEGEASTTRGEILRCIGRLYYDCFNNGLCNDKSDEVFYLLKNKHKFGPFLHKDSRGMRFLQDLKNQYFDEEDIRFDFSEESNKALDDLIDAILLYVQDEEKREAASIPLELRLTDPRDWVREYKEVV
jgi:hypothetical protein